MVELFDRYWKKSVSLLKNKSKKTASLQGMQAKKKKALALLIILVIFAFILLTGIFTSAPKKSHPHKHAHIVIKTDTTGLESWQTQSSAQLSSLTQGQLHQKKSTKLLTVRLREQRATIDSLSEKLNRVSLQMSELTKKQRQQSINNHINTNNTAFPTKLFPQTPTVNDLVVKPVPVDVTSTLSRPVGLQIMQAPKTKERNIHSTINQTHYKKNDKLGWFPAGSFFKGALLNGLDAATGQTAQSNPEPVLIQITDNAFLPNQYRYQVKQCRVLGSAYGSLSSERVFIRTTSISCVGFGGKDVITSDLKGYIVDSDGKLGLRGKIINRQGAKLGLALLAGFAGGLSDAYGNGIGTVSSSAFGTVNTVSGSAAMQQAGYNGVSNASNELAKFLIDEAKTIYPIIEVNAGRNVTIVLNQGESIRWQNSATPYIAVAINPNSQSNKTPRTHESVKSVDDVFGPTAATNQPHQASLPRAQTALIKQAMNVSQQAALPQNEQHALFANTGAN